MTLEEVNLKMFLEKASKRIKEENSETVAKSRKKENFIFSFWLRPILGKFLSPNIPRRFWMLGYLPLSLDMKVTEK